VELDLIPGSSIKKDSHADIVPMGIKGFKTIEIRGGSNQAPFLREDDFINAGPERILQQGKGRGFNGP
jgi:hypothetical protein